MNTMNTMNNSLTIPEIVKDGRVINHVDNITRFRIVVGVDKNHFLENIQRFDIHMTAERQTFQINDG